MDYLTGLCFFGPLLLAIPVLLAWGALTLYVRFVLRPSEDAPASALSSCSLVVGSLGVMFWCLLTAVIRNWIRRGLYPAWVYLRQWYGSQGPQGQTAMLGFGAFLICGLGLIFVAASIAAATWVWRRRSAGQPFRA